MPFATVRDLETYYELHGSGERVLSISGTGGDLRMNPLRGSGPLEAAFEVLMYDQRGLGQTSKPEATYTMADYADDAAALMDALGWQSAHVVGTSFGGMVAQHVAIRHPQRVGRLVLACTSSGGEGGSSQDLLALDDLGADERLRKSMSIMDSRNDFSVDPPQLEPFTAMIIEHYRSMPRPEPGSEAARGARRQLEARADHDTWAQLPQITSPTLVVGGEYDLLAPPANQAALAERIPGARLQMFAGGHMFLMQDPAAWPAIIEFLRG